MTALHGSPSTELFISPVAWTYDRPCSDRHLLERAGLVIGAVGRRLMSMIKSRLSTARPSASSLLQTGSVSNEFRRRASGLAHRPGLEAGEKLDTRCGRDLLLCWGVNLGCSGGRRKRSRTQLNGLGFHHRRRLAPCVDIDNLQNEDLIDEHPEKCE